MVVTIYTQPNKYKIGRYSYCVQNTETNKKRRKKLTRTVTITVNTYKFYNILSFYPLSSTSIF